MDTNISAWLIGGGPRLELESTRREREQLHAFRESQRLAAEPTLVERLIRAIRPERPVEPACCPA